MVKVRGFRPNLEGEWEQTCMRRAKRFHLARHMGFKKTKLKIRTSVIMFVSAGVSGVVFLSSSWL